MRISYVTTSILHTEDCVGNVMRGARESSPLSSETSWTLNVFSRTLGLTMARLALLPERPALEPLCPEEVLREVARTEVLAAMEVLATVEVDYRCRDLRPRAQYPISLALPPGALAPSLLPL